MGNRTIKDLLYDLTHIMQAKRQRDDSELDLAEGCVDINSYVAELEEGEYTGFIVIATPTYHTVKGAVRDIMDLSQIFEIGVMPEDIDLSDVRHLWKDRK